MFDLHLQWDGRLVFYDPVFTVAQMLVPGHIDAQCRPCLLSTTLVDAPGGLHHLLHGLVLTQCELVDHRGAVLNHSHLQ